MNYSDAPCNPLACCKALFHKSDSDRQMWVVHTIMLPRQAAVTGLISVHTSDLPLAVKTTHAGVARHKGSDAADAPRQ
jgi:hypothetical protein